jgi:DNA-binding XRE family transcriptional regulator
MKMRHTEQMDEILLQLPPPATDKVRNAIQGALKSLGHTMQIRLLNDEEEELLTFKEVFPDAHPGLFIRGLRNRDELTQQRLADMLGTTQAGVAEMESGKVPITNRMAQKLGKIFDTPYQMFL